MKKEKEDVKDDEHEECTKPCVDCGKNTVYRVFNYVDGQWLDDGCYCDTCKDWVADPD